MRRFFALGAALVLLGWSAPALAREQRVYIPSGQVISGNYYAAGEVVEIAGNVESDLIVAAGNVVVSGMVGGDVIAAGGNVRITGSVSGDVRVFGGRVELAGTVERNVTVAAGELTLAQGSNVSGHVTAAAGTMELRGRIGGGLMAAGGIVTASGSIEGPVTLWLDRQGVFEVRETASFNKSVTYYSDKEASVSAGASFTEQPQRHSLPVPTRSGERHWFGWLVSLFGSLVLAMVCVKFVPQWLQRTAGAVISRPWPSLGFGALWLFVAPLVMIVLMITLIGLPLAILLMFVYVAGFIIAPVLIGAVVAQMLGRWKHISQWVIKLSPFVAVAIGLVIYKIISILPILGGLIVFVGILLVLGATVRTLFRFGNN